MDNPRSVLGSISRVGGAQSAGTRTEGKSVSYDNLGLGLRVAGANGDLSRYGLDRWGRGTKGDLASGV